MLASSTIPPFEEVDQGSEHEEPATDARDEQGESNPPPRTLVFPLCDRRFVGPFL